MLKLISSSSNQKVGNCAVTYRAGQEDVYGTCPSGCPLKPSSGQGSTTLNTEYLQAVLESVPRQGKAWTYTHFKPADGVPISASNQTCINISTDSIDDAVTAFEQGYPTVVVRPHYETDKVDRVTTPEGRDIRLVRCPAEYQDKLTCRSCGSGNPLCARHDRDYIVKFTAHGVQKKRIAIRVEAESGAQATLPGVEVSAQAGGCYGSSGPVHLQWKRSMGSTESDAQAIRRFANDLPVGTLLRHHVVGDLG